MITLVLILAAIFTFLLLLWNLLHYYMERKFRRSFGFNPPRSGDKYSIQALQPMVDRKLRELAAAVAKDKAEMKQIVSYLSRFTYRDFSPLGKFTQKGRELGQVRGLYGKLNDLDFAISEANFYNFKIGQREDYL
jgi:hypothetical protein